MKNNNNNKIRTALITGKHPFDIPNLYKLFKSFDNVEFYPQNLDDYISDWGNCRKFYDVLIFYKSLNIKISHKNIENFHVSYLIYLKNSYVEP